jgi:tetratricopeptide (TPR) repeat protein
MRVLKTFFGVIFGMALLGSSAHGQQPKKSDLETAMDLLKAGHADQSLALVDPIIAQAMLKQAKDPTAICPSAAVAVLQSFMKGNFVVSVENDWCDAMLVKAYALNELKRPTEAEQVLQALVRHDPDNAQYLIEYAYTVRVNGQLERSLDLYKRAEGVASKFPDRSGAAHWRAAALRGQGYDYTELQRWDDATKAYQRSFKYEPDNDIARNELQYISQHRPH